MRRDNIKVNYKSNTNQTKPANLMKKRTPRTVVLDQNIGRNKPALISEAFNLKNFDIVGKVDEMRVLTKELSIMARQLEQWVAVIYTVGMAFKDSGVLRELVKTVSSINIGDNSNNSTKNNNQHNSSQNSTPFSFPFFQNHNESKENAQRNQSSQGSNSGVNFAEIFNNPVFKELITNLFTQNKNK